MSFEYRKNLGYNETRSIDYRLSERVCIYVLQTYSEKQRYNNWGLPYLKLTLTPIEQIPFPYNEID